MVKSFRAWCAKLFRYSIHNDQSRGNQGNYTICVVGFKWQIRWGAGVCELDGYSLCQEAVKDAGKSRQKRCYYYKETKSFNMKSCSLKGN